eukprot:2141699-Pleurochrysis_carterae.AAC.1
MIAKAVAARAAVVLSRQPSTTAAPLPPRRLPPATSSATSVDKFPQDSFQSSEDTFTQPASLPMPEPISTTVAEEDPPAVSEPRFRRGLGSYPLRNREPTVLFTARSAREANPDLRYRGSGCAFSLSADTPGPKTRKQALRDDRSGWTAAERSEIANHEANGSWRMMDRSEVPQHRNLVRLIWVYKRKRSGALKARLCVQGCSQIKGVDYEQ